jgi:putative ABC transport system permease protein
MGCAMLFTRLYPYIIRLLFSVGRSVWPPAIYASLSAARSRPRSRYIMLFIILTIANSLVTSASARTINQNCLDRAMYDIGADLVIQERWSFTDPNPQFDLTTGAYIKPDDKELFFIEPPFEIFSEPQGVALATKVYRNNRAMVMRPNGSSVYGVNVMAIYPDEFARVSWRRDDMYAYHLNYMMNAMSVNPNVVLLSRRLMDQLGLSHGDEIQVLWANNRDALPCYVYDAVDYFPTFNPLTPDVTLAHLVVMNYELINAEYRLEPYEVWMMKEEEASSTDIAQYILNNRESQSAQVNVPQFGLNAPRIDISIHPLSVNNAQASLASVRNDPLILSMNGFLTLNFVMILAVTVAGFLVFWSFDLRSRRLQISIMRSAGMPKTGVIAMLLWEQVLLSLLPLIAGFVLGRIGSSLL